ncbi:Protein kinase-like domain, Concanavalin A-like lectin/glucanase domain protein [Melia azedarach]|uniref:Protein kinase-like domain, Concanavalin A-like lectin/glucanase domain protein n=1 Tax=Melia azedarach TaxID=155640 RepID=A0ACC1YDY7_MELAZ|nr:Protein kinase-like domain, Concanavalin A-like lectin/glucanase domain protein [Melia azedarach]
MRHKLSKGKAERLAIALFVVLTETTSVLLDVFTNGWKPSLAGLCLSLVGFLTAFYFCCVKTAILNIKPLALRQLATQEIVLSVIQLTASIVHLLAFLLHRKEIFDVSVFIPLSFAIVATPFAFFEEKKDGYSGDLSPEDFISTNRNSTPEASDPHEYVIAVNDSNPTNISGLRHRPRPVTRGRPRIQNLRITGEARPGEKLLGSAEFVNETSSCTFQWVRASSLLGSHKQRIEGATEQDYVVTVDDVDKLIALECIPVDDQGHQGQLVRVFANGNSKIECDPDMKREIERHILNRKAIFYVQLLITSTQQWEPATLIVSWPSYKIKINSTEAVGNYRSHVFRGCFFDRNSQWTLNTIYFKMPRFCTSAQHKYRSNA